MLGRCSFGSGWRAVCRQVARVGGVASSLQTGDADWQRCGQTQVFSRDDSKQESTGCGELHRRGCDMHLEPARRYASRRRLSRRQRARLSRARRDTRAPFLGGACGRRRRARRYVAPAGSNGRAAEHCEHLPRRLRYESGGAEWKTPGRRLWLLTWQEFGALVSNVKARTESTPHHSLGMAQEPRTRAATGERG
jgi:hypothetical protein